MLKSTSILRVIVVKNRLLDGHSLHAAQKQRPASINELIHAIKNFISFKPGISDRKRFQFFQIKCSKKILHSDVLNCQMERFCSSRIDMHEVPIGGGVGVIQRHHTAAPHDGKHFSAIVLSPREKYMAPASIQLDNSIDWEMNLTNRAATC